MTTAVKPITANSMLLCCDFLDMIFIIPYNNVLNPISCLIFYLNPNFQNPFSIESQFSESLFQLNFNFQNFFSIEFRYAVNRVNS